jgi:flagellar basal body rod protein FlgG
MKMMIDALHIAAGGLQQAEARLEGAASNAASGRAEPVNTSVDLLTSIRHAEANANAVRTSDDMVGTLLDLFA